ncbi:MAG: hypothetical protein M3Y35_18165 [Actinomycetota bacterium]|nr:hypothetical protein [Actinomycetota bacterium]
MHAIQKFPAEVTARDGRLLPAAADDGSRTLDRRHTSRERATAGAPTAGTRADGSLPLPTATPGTKPLSGKLVGPVARHFTGTKQVFVQFAGSGAADTARGTIKQGKGKVTAKQASQARKAAARATTAEVVAAAKSKDKST